MIIFWITGIVITIYLLYPLSLRLLFPVYQPRVNPQEAVDGVSVILLSYNGKELLSGKINMILDELSGFRQKELLVMDDHSEDGSGEVLAVFKDHPLVRVYISEERMGIPHAMNKAVSLATFPLIVFCDQRQGICRGSFNEILTPLQDTGIGAVSGILAQTDVGCRDSVIRRHENRIKMAESNTGNIMGAYGPLYVLKKELYVDIPPHIILDDLYLILCVLRSHKVVMANTCVMTDLSFSSLYSFQRTRRYLSGLLQILGERSLIAGLSGMQRCMLLWHKYLRLLIPPLLMTCYITLGLSGLRSVAFAMIFLGCTILAGISFLPVTCSWHGILRVWTRLLMYYNAAIVTNFGYYFITAWRDRKQP